MYLDEIDDDDDQQFDDDNDEDVAADLEAALKQTDDEGTDAGDDSISEDSEESDSDDEDLVTTTTSAGNARAQRQTELEDDDIRLNSEIYNVRVYVSSISILWLTSRIASPPPRPLVLTPAQIRRKGLVFAPTSPPRSFVVEAVAALPHPGPTHSLAASACMTHLLTGSDDGYIRDYDIFPALNGKNFLTAPQRHYSGIVEGILKTVPIRYWWENHSRIKGDVGPPEDDLSFLPVYSLAMHPDALWSLAGTNRGTINLFTVRHEAGRLCHVFDAGHHGQPISSMCLDHNEMKFFSGGWDGDAIQWDLNTGQIVRNFYSHGAQLAVVSLRPENALHPPQIPPSTSETAADEQPTSTAPPTVKQEADADAKSEASYDPLFDDEPEPERERMARLPRAIAPPQNAPPLLDQPAYSTFSPDILMTAYIDGQVVLWDRRVHSAGAGVGRLWMSEKTPPWCLSACWSGDGNQIYAGRRNGTVDVWDVRQYGSSSKTARLLKTLKNPGSSGVVSCVAALPDGRHIASASIDNLRLWNVADAGETDGPWKSKSGLQFKIIPGHHGGYVSQILVDPGSRFLVSASSNRGWHGESTRTVFIHDIKPVY
ncbi:WD40-repeat-containing domain protein [Pterulicium gracile]|uniref:WD40-repeat-containing domain protein n=1 Tax=Pterulicium gracile TaxID=1884261 RepID=A0A5C3QZM1_9AGAR|nr:WD40-repeat-containing domain protein [Pterula gracilis]